MSKSRTEETDAISAILTRTQRLLKIEAQKADSAFHQAQLLLSEYMDMLAETQAENARLRQLLGSYPDSPPGRKKVPASLVMSSLQERVAALSAAVTTLRGALEKIRACESEVARRKPGEIAAKALRSVAKSGRGADPGSRPGTTAARKVARSG